MHCKLILTNVSKIFNLLGFSIFQTGPALGWTRQCHRTGSQAQWGGSSHLEVAQQQRAQASCHSACFSRCQHCQRARAMPGCLPHLPSPAACQEGNSPASASPLLLLLPFRVEKHWACASTYPARQQNQRQPKEGGEGREVSRWADSWLGSTPSYPLLLLCFLWPLTWLWWGRGLPRLPHNF